MYARLLATGAGIPDRVVKNDFFGYLVEDADEWIFSRTGIRERRFVDPTVATSDLATVAARDALERAGIAATDLDCIIVATSTPDMIMPATAAMVQKNIGAANAFAFDMNAVCSSFVYAVDTADSLIRSGKYRTLMVIGADTYSKILDYDDKGSCPLFGDGASAVILQASEQPGIMQTVVKSDGSRWEMIQVPSSGSRKPITAETIALKENTFKMAGKSVFVFATEMVPRLIDEIIAKAGITLDEVDYLIPHQANVRIIDFISKKKGIGKERFLLNLDRFGNTAAASVGLVLDENLKSGVLKPGHRVLMMGFGGGLSWGGILLQI
jgi:3-oxoacyl-[acyl-carrier-protein] synthase III